MELSFCLNLKFSKVYDIELERYRDQKIRKFLVKQKQPMTEFKPILLF